VMRILDPSSATLGIDALGYDPDQKEALLKAIERPYGMVLVTGPTGSGKTVSLYTCLNILNKPGINISTAEDPAEINLPGVNQEEIFGCQAIVNDRDEVEGMNEHLLIGAVDLPLQDVIGNCFPWYPQLPGTLDDVLPSQDKDGIPT